MKLLLFFLTALVMVYMGGAKNSYFLKKTVPREIDNNYKVQIANLSNLRTYHTNFVNFQKNYLKKIFFKSVDFSSKLEIIDYNNKENYIVFNNPQTNLTELYRPVEIEINSPSNLLIENSELKVEIQIFNENIKDNSKKLCLSLLFVVSNYSNFLDNNINSIINSVEKPSNQSLDLSLFMNFINQGSYINYKLPSFTKNTYDWIVSLEYLPISKILSDKISKMIYNKRYLRLFKSKPVELDYLNSFIFKKKSDLLDLEKSYFNFKLKHFEGLIKTFKNHTQEEDNQFIDDYDFMNLIEKNYRQKNDEDEIPDLDTEKDEKDKKKAGKDNHKAGKDKEKAGKDGVDSSEDKLEMENDSEETEKDHSKKSKDSKKHNKTEKHHKSHNESIKKDPSHHNSGKSEEKDHSKKPKHSKKNKTKKHNKTEKDHKNHNESIKKDPSHHNSEKSEEKDHSKKPKHSKKNKTKKHNKTEKDHKNHNESIKKDPSHHNSENNHDQNHSKKNKTKKYNKTKKHPKNDHEIPSTIQPSNGSTSVHNKTNNISLSHQSNSTIIPISKINNTTQSTQIDPKILSSKNNNTSTQIAKNSTDVKSNTSNANANTTITNGHGLTIDRNEDVINLPHVFKHENVNIHKGEVNIETTLIIGPRCCS